MNTAKCLPLNFKEVHVRRPKASGRRSFGAFSQSNLAHVARTVQRDKNLKRKVIAEIRKDLPSFIERRFRLSRKQKALLRARLSKPTADAIAHVCIMALQHGSKLEFHVVNNPKKTALIEAGFHCEPAVQPTGGSGQPFGAPGDPSTPGPPDWQCTATVSWGC